MIIPKSSSKALLTCIIFTVALRQLSVSGITMKNNKDNEINWVHRALLLDASSFLPVCKQVFLRQEHLQKSSYLMSDYAEEVSDLCRRFAPNPEQGTCRMNDFKSLGSSFQNTFFRHAADHMAHADKLPIQILMSMGDGGYIVSDKSKAELDSMRNDLCVELHLSFGDEFLNEIPDLNIPDYPIFDAVQHQTDKPKLSITSKPSSSPTSTIKPEEQPIVATTVPTESKNNAGQELPSSTTESNIGEDQVHTGSINNGSFEIMEVKGDHALSIGSIVGISCAVAMCIALFFYSEARRRDRARSRNFTRGRQKGHDEDGLLKHKKKIDSFHHSGSTITVGSSGAGFASSANEIREAINNANWDNVYKLASQLAENDDGLTIPSSIGLLNKKYQDRSHLAAEDLERTKILDELADNGDWTGLAVTAALYAGETSSCSGERSKAFKRNMVEPRRPSTVHLPSLRSSQRNQDIEEGNSSMEQMVGRLSKALNAGDWSQVNYFATKIKDERGGNSFDTDTQAFVLTPPSLSSSASIVSADTTDTEISKKQTIEKLMRAGKWKGVSIMANMYEMETKQQSNNSHPSSTRSPSNNSTSPPPNQQYKDKRLFRTKELRHSDRVQENIVGFRQDP